MTLDTKARNTANKMIAKFGKSITLTRVTEGSYDPTTGEMAASTNSTATLSALIQDYKPFEYVSGAIESGDRQVTIAALDATIPNIGDTITIDALVYSVISVKTVWSGELAALYELQVRK